MMGSIVTRVIALLERQGPGVAVTGVGLAGEAGLVHVRPPAPTWDDPRALWDAYGPQMRAMAQAAPSPGHEALARLVRAGDLLAVITENPDVLHEQAGTPNVIELGGSVAHSMCPACGYSEPLACLIAILPVPRCAACGAVLRPGTLEPTRELSHRDLERARSAIDAAAFVLVAGTVASREIGALVQATGTEVVELATPASTALTAIAATVDGAR
jgi:NAD-dependent deacetylase